ncbi:hypothetical protein [Hydrogenophaga laconesensis]|nr:hypothetical protein [Hydrogenophaga laconesensis]
MASIGKPCSRAQGWRSGNRRQVMKTKEGMALNSTVITQWKATPIRD